MSVGEGAAEEEEEVVALRQPLLMSLSSLFVGVDTLLPKCTKVQQFLRLEGLYLEQANL